MASEISEPTLGSGPTAGREEVRHFISRLPSENFFQEICDFLALTLQMEYVLIGRITGKKPETVMTLGVSIKGHASEKIEYELPGTPCENVVGRNLCYYPLNVAQLFPSDKILQDLRIQSYLGIPLNSPDGKPLGLISVFSKHPIENVLVVEQILEEIKPRCEKELYAYAQKLKQGSK